MAFDADLVTAVAHLDTFRAASAKQTVFDALLTSATFRAGGIFFHALQL